MKAVIPFPDISNEIFSLTVFGVTLALRWYALAYLAGLIAGWRIIMALMARPGLWPDDRAPMEPKRVEDLLTAIVVGVILGGRLGFVLFYQRDYYLANPAEILKVWQGGMSFHGGFLGVTVAGLWFCQREAISKLSTGDLLAMVAPIGLFLGRIANFINAELWGRPSDLPWAVAFPGDAAQACISAAGVCTRHPSQIYEALLEGLLLGAALLWLIWRRGWLRFPGASMGLFLAGYGAARFAVEFFRQPDPQFVTEGNPVGLAWQIGGWGLTQGQALSVPMLAVGLWFLLRSRAA